MTEADLTLLDVLRRSEDWLRRHGMDTPRLDAELLIGHVLGLERLKLYLMFDRPMSAEERDQVRDLVRRRGQHEPVAYLLGHRGFHRVDLAVRPGVLIPQPDTETLVEAAREWIGASPGPVFVADVGCGSGAVGLALAAASPEIRVYATDLMPTPIEVTKANAAALGLQERVAALRGPLLDPIPAHRPIDWVVSNPPYIPTGDIDGLMPEVSRWAPREALDGGRDGLDVVRAVTAAARARARRGVLLEIGHDQAARTARILTDAGFVDVRTWRDLGGIERVVGGLQPG
ncbi:MAG TPA: peptide chain release factor N(5)-glutamine methyltransferase [Myxococcota bacterium]|nr:peptide chain release factor N(5)-glutamine methyltransferase [Myxococcota bacterium]